MRLIRVYWNVARVYRAKWYRRQAEKLMDKVEAYLDSVEGL
ncbi:hypothetical protein [Devosia sp.]|nr:hypothetical protein [Devosia sp.]